MVGTVLDMSGFIAENGSFVLAPIYDTQSSMLNMGRNYVSELLPFKDIS